MHLPVVVTVPSLRDVVLTLYIVYNNLNIQLALFTHTLLRHAYMLNRFAKQ